MTEVLADKDETATTTRVISKDFSFLKGTSRVIVLGAPGAGKSATMHYIAEQLHLQGVKINMLAPQKILKLQKEKGIPPTWMRLINYKYPRIEEDTMTLYDDAQLRSHAREWYESRNVRFIKVLSLVRHKHSGVIITTQEAKQVDSGCVSLTDYLICKQPGILSSRMERPEVRKILINVQRMYDKEIVGKGLDPQEYSYVVSNLREGFVGPTGLASYWSSELGDW